MRMMKMKLSECQIQVQKLKEEMCQIQVQKLKEEMRTMGGAGVEKEKVGGGNTNHCGRKMPQQKETNTGGAQHDEQIEAQLEK